MHRLIAIALLLLGSACAQLPRPELQSFSESYRAARAASDQITADYAVAERAQRLRVMRNTPARNYDDFFPTFEPGDAAALSQINLPPGAAAIDRAFNAIGSYNDTLVALAEGRNIDEARAQLQSAIGDLGAAIPGGGQAATALQPVAALLVTALRPAIEAGNREIFREVVLNAQPQVLQLIRALRDFTPTQYSTTTSALRISAEADPPATNRAEVVERINGWHRVFADYVALLNVLEGRLMDLHSAVRNPRSRPLLQRVADGSAELRAYSEILRASLAELRSGT